MSKEDNGVSRVRVPVGLILLEEVARELASELRRRELVTRVVDLRDRVVDFDLTVFNAKVGGKLHELMLRSVGKNYRVILITDGAVKIDRAFDELMQVSGYLESIDAFEANGEYVLRLRDYSWLESASAIIRVNEKTIFRNVFCKWDEFL